MKKVAKAWGLLDSAAKVQEWVRLATTEVGAERLGEGDRHGYAMNPTDTPLTFYTYIDRLFVPFSDTTFLEEMVSQYRQFSDLRMGPLVTEYIVLYQASLRDDR